MPLHVLQRTATCCVVLPLACHGCIGTVCRTVACCCPVCCGHVAAAHCAVLGCCLACCGHGAAAHHVVARCCLARRVSWHGAWPWRLMARRAIPGVLRVVVWCTATVCRGTVHSCGVSWRGGRPQRGAVCRAWRMSQSRCCGMLCCGVLPPGVSCVAAQCTAISCRV